MNRPKKENYYHEAGGFTFISDESKDRYIKDLEAYCNELEAKLDKYKPIKKAPCRCGYNGKKRFVRDFIYWKVKCPKCGFEVEDRTDSVFSKRNLNKLWNEAVGGIK